MLWNRKFLHLLFPQFSITLYQAGIFYVNYWLLGNKTFMDIILLQKHVNLYNKSWHLKMLVHQLNPLLIRLQRSLRAKN